MTRHHGRPAGHGARSTLSIRGHRDGSLATLPRDNGRFVCILWLSDFLDERRAPVAYALKNLALLQNVLVNRRFAMGLALLAGESALLVRSCLQRNQQSDAGFNELRKRSHLSKCSGAPDLIGERMNGCNLRKSGLVRSREGLSNSMPELPGEPDEVQIGKRGLPLKLKPLGTGRGNLIFKLAILAPEIALSRNHAIHRGSAPVTPIAALLKTDGVDERPYREQSLCPSRGAAPPREGPAGPEGQKAVIGHLLHVPAPCRLAGS